MDTRDVAYELILIEAKMIADDNIGFVKEQFRRMYPSGDQYRYFVQIAYEEMVQEHVAAYEKKLVQSSYVVRARFLRGLANKHRDAIDDKDALRRLTEQLDRVSLDKW